MRLVTYEADGSSRAGIQVGDLIVDARAAGRRLANGAPGERWHSTRSILAADPDLRDELGASAATLVQAGGPGVSRQSEVRLLPPVPDPDKIVCLGLNYREHASEMALETPVAPALFAKFRNALTGSGSPIVLPAASAEVDFEGELAVVIGRRSRNVSEDEALACVAGYMPLNDVSARDLQMRTSQWTAGKVPDTFAPCGPALVLSDEVPDAQSLQITTRVNGATVQSASTARMIFAIADTVSFLSGLMTLEIGDIIATGTPAGVGYKREPPLFLGPGDVVEVEIERLGVLSNPVIAHDRSIELAAGGRSGGG